MQYEIEYSFEAREVAFGSYAIPGPGLSFPSKMVRFTSARWRPIFRWWDRRTWSRKWRDTAVPE